MNRIDTIMKQQDISRKELAAKLGVSPQYISEVVNNKKNITLAGLQKFAKALHVPLSALIEDDIDPNAPQSFKCPYCGNTITICKSEQK